MKKIPFVLLLLISHFVQAACVDDIPTTSGPFDIDFAEGQLLDQSTDLVWFRCRLGQTFENDVCVGDAFAGTWLEALKLAEEFSISEFNNWRLPNLKELQSLVEYSCQSPMFSPDLFATNMTGLYWSSTPELVEQGMFNHYVHGLSSNGHTFSDQKDELFSALLVRDSLISKP